MSYESALEAAISDPTSKNAAKDINAASLGINEFVRRQTPDAPYSHFDGSFEALVDRVASAIQEDPRRNVKPGYRDGVVLVSVPAEGFFCGYGLVTPETELVTTFEARRPEEEPVLVTRMRGQKVLANFVDVVLYSHDALAENDEASTDCEWEIISVNARLFREEDPMHPTAMARNQLERVGGTAATYSAEEWALAVHFWAFHAMIHIDGGDDD